MWTNNQHKNKFGWKSKFFFLFLIIILVFLGLNLTKSWKKSREINQEIASLEKEIEVLSGDKLKLEKLIEYFNSTAYIEEKARKDLGLKKEGEKVVIVGNQNITDSSLSNSNTIQDGKDKKISNPKKWWNYFFQ